MQLSINAAHFRKNRAGLPERNLTECLSLVHNAGFHAVDLNTRDEDPAEVRAFLAKKGMHVNQSHLPFNRYKRADFTVFSAEMMRCARTAQQLDSKILVVHGDEFDAAQQPYTKQAVLEFNKRLFTPLVDFAVQHGMKVAFECVFEESIASLVPRFCSKTEDLLTLVQHFSSEHVGVCWDFGHAKVQYGPKMAEELRKAAPYLIATHVHDNYYQKDLHLFPFLGDTDWETNMRILQQEHYSGDLTFEFVYENIPDALLPEYLHLIYKTGEYLLNMATKS